MVVDMLPGVTVKQLEQWRREGKGPAYRKPNNNPRSAAVIYRQDEVIAWIERGRTSTRGQP